MCTERTPCLRIIAFSQTLCRNNQKNTVTVNIRFGDGAAPFYIFTEVLNVSLMIFVVHAGKHSLVG